MVSSNSLIRPGWEKRCRRQWNHHVGRTLVFAAIILVSLNCLAVSAKNLDLLIRYLVPIFLSQDFAATCRLNDPAFLTELPHGPRTVDEFSEQMKKEITYDLTESEAGMVVLVAANTARRAAEDQMRKLSPEFPRLPAEPLNQWCHDDARPYILAVIRTDRERHDEFLKTVRKAAHSSK